MFPRRYFPARYFAPSYWGQSAAAAPSGQVVLFFSLGGVGVSSCQGVSIPTLALESLGGDNYNVTVTHQVSDDGLEKQAVTIDGELP